MITFQSMLVGVIGFGQMGSGIAQVCAIKGYRTFVYDENKDILEKNLEKLKNQLSQLVDRGKLTMDQYARFQENLTLKTELGDLEKCDLIVEAIVEDPQSKAKLFERISSFTSKIIATNTSSISITWLSRFVKRPERFIGIHFM
ncbi:MAG: 3-hydroxyacyl-CoA dehydrogenase NAD-binding domain-containing protein, partial [Deltaproteobacteria bacterium]|nr:3-hydroxyacyl-CoA dehydrogenase NAD-binding domain-containing protein [Deltaproteobacteria bacterium]